MGCLRLQKYYLSVVLYGCETWLLTFGEDRRIGLFETRVLRRIFGPKRDEVMREWRKLLTGLYSSPKIVQMIKLRKMRWVHIGERRDVYMVLVGKPEGRRPHGKPKRRWDDNIQIDLPQMGCGGMDWMELTQDKDRWWALVNAIMNLRVP